MKIFEITFRAFEVVLNRCGGVGFNSFFFALSPLFLQFATTIQPNSTMLHQVLITNKEGLAASLHPLCPVKNHILREMSQKSSG
jgi:hypothetical protein